MVVGVVVRVCGGTWAVSWGDPNAIAAVDRSAIPLASLGLGIVGAEDLQLFGVRCVLHHF
jgi:hypothetical protein